VQGDCKRGGEVPLLAANVRKAGDGSPAFGEVVLKTGCGVRVAIVGLVTPGVPT
jgi:2',3'-cyclic-nucleotide 2'-phosphodiesterase/3'-nucleotidase